MLVAAPGRAPALPAPVLTLAPEALLTPGSPAPELRPQALPLPKEGGRIALVAGNRQVGWLDVWGNGAPASLPARRALCDVARLVAVLLAKPGPDAHS